MLTKFTVDRFKGAFADGFSFAESRMKDGKKRVLGSSMVVRLELIENQKRILESAVIVFPFFLTDKELNHLVSALVIRFLEFCLPPSIPAVTWIEEAKQGLQPKDVVRYERKYEGLSVALVHIKDRPEFFLIAERR